MNELFLGFLSGGTHFTLLDLTYRSERGSLLLHPSRVYHAGMEIDAGKRYILVGFVQVHRTNFGYADNLFLSLVGPGAPFFALELSLEEVWCSGSMHGASGG